MWPTASARDWKDSEGQSMTGTNPDGSLRKRTDQLARAVFAYGRQDQANDSSGGSPQEQPQNPEIDWRTPTAEQMGVGEHMDTARLKLGARVYNKNGKLMAIDLNRQMEIVERNQGTKKNSGKLNPRWVETLMGVPIGWVMPSCTSPVTIEPMN